MGDRASRDSAVSEAAVFGVAGLALLSVGSLAASALVSALDPWVAVVPALIVWMVAAYVAMRLFAHGVYTVVEDAVAQ